MEEHALLHRRQVKEVYHIVSRLQQFIELRLVDARERKVGRRMGSCFRRETVRD